MSATAETEGIQSTRITPPTVSTRKRTLLRADQARELVNAQTRYDKAKREFEAAKDERDRLLAKLLPKFELGSWVTVAGWAIRVTMQSSGARFSLSEYLKTNKLTAAMKPFVTEGAEHPRLWVKPDKPSG